MTSLISRPSSGHPLTQVKLVVLDSVTSHFRQDFKDMAHRTRVLTKMAQDMMSVAEKHGLAVRSTRVQLIRV